MAIKGLASHEVHEYICRDDPSRTREEGATIFHLGSIPSAVITRISDQQLSSTSGFGDVGSQTFTQRTAHRNRECFRFGLRSPGWENFPDPNGIPIQFKQEIVMEGGRTYNVVSDEAMDQIPLAIVQEVGAELWNTNNLTDEQRKNFEASLSRFGGSSTSSAPSAATQTSSNEDATDQPSTEGSEREPSSPPMNGVLDELPPNAALAPTPPRQTRKSPTRSKTAQTGTGKTP